MDGKEAVVLVDLSLASDEVIVLILKRVPARELLTACTQVSKQWRRILSATFFWKEKLEEVDGYRLPWPRLAAGLSVNSYQRMAIKQPFRRNFIRDCWDLTTLSCRLDRRWHTNRQTVWQLDANRGWFDKLPIPIEMPPVFSQQPEMGPELGGEPVLACLASTDTPFRKWIVIRLADEGLTDQLMDIYRPTIIVSELIANRLDSASEYQMQCYLSRYRNGPGSSVLRNNFPIHADMAEEATDQLVGAFRRKRFQQGEAESWQMVRHEFKQYPAGMRFLILEASANKVKLARSSVMALCQGNV